MSGAEGVGGAAVRSRPFIPSIARDVDSRDASDRPGSHASAGMRSRAAVWAFSIGVSVSASYVPTHAAVIVPARPAQAAPAGRPLAVHGAQRDQASAATQDMVAKLKAKGMPVAALSDVLDVERKTVYSWLDDGIEANPGNYERLRVVHSLLADEADGSLRFFHRFWDRKLPGGTSLKAALTASAIEAEAVSAALDALRPAVSRAMQAEADRKAASGPRSPASSLTLNLRAGA